MIARIQVMLLLLQGMMVHLYQPPPPHCESANPLFSQIMDLDGTLDKCNHESASCSDHITNEHFFIHRVERPTANNISDSTHPCFHKSLLILYFNCRSLLPKLDELAAICATDNPDIVCLVETWLCSDVLDNEVLIPNYSTIRLDRNRHGGGGGGGGGLLCTFKTLLLTMYYCMDLLI